MGHWTVIEHEGHYSDSFKPESEVSNVAQYLRGGRIGRVRVCDSLGVALVLTQEECSINDDMALIMLLGLSSVEMISLPHQLI